MKIYFEKQKKRANRLAIKFLLDVEYSIFVLIDF
jgi:hypothetical protein